MDYLVLLLILSKWGHSDLWSDPGNVVHFVIFPPKTSRIVRVSEKLNHVRVNGQSGCFVNEMAGERADEGSLSDAGPIYKLNISHLCDEAAMKLKLNRFYIRLFRFYSCHPVPCTQTLQNCVPQHGPVVSNVIASCHDSLSLTE